MKKVMSVCLILLVGVFSAFAGGTGEGTGSAAATSTATISKPASLRGKTITMLVGYAPGGGNDICARTIQQIAKKRQDLDFIVENLPGAAGNIAMQKNMRSKPDGTTIMLTGVSQIVGMLDGQLPNDFGEATWITTLIANVNALWVKADSPYKTADEFFAAVGKSKPGEFIFGSTGVRAQSEGMLWETVEALGPKGLVTGIMFDGGARCVAELIGGHISAALLKFNDVIGQFQAGEIKPLCVFTEERIPLYSDLPSVFEFDWWGNQISYGGSDFMGLYLTGPKGLPKDIVEYYEAVMKDVLTSDEFREATKPWVCLIDPVLSGKEFMVLLERTRDSCKDMIEKYFK